MTLRTALDQGIRLLEESRVLAPRLTAEVLLAHALRRDRVWLYAHPEELLSEMGWIHYGHYLYQRTEGVPTQYITKKQEFYGRDFHVSPAVLIPRPETEHVVAAALPYLAAGVVAADIGTGSGAIAITLALESGVPVYGSDVSAEALKIASRNRSDLGARVQFICGDLLSVFRDHSLDLIVSNPPYVPLADKDGLQREVRDYEPHLALFGGPDGNVMYRRIVEDARRVLRPGGRLVLELGYRSMESVSMLLRGWDQVQTEGDLAGIPRVMSARLE